MNVKVRKQMCSDVWGEVNNLALQATKITGFVSYSLPGLNERRREKCAAIDRLLPLLNDLVRPVANIETQSEFLKITERSMFLGQVDQLVQDLKELIYDLTDDDDMDEIANDHARYINRRVCYFWRHYDTLFGLLRTLTRAEVKEVAE